MMTLLLLLCASTLALAGTLQVDVLDVGQGDAILLRSPDGKTALIDAGTGGVEVVPLLRARGVQQLDLVIATHPHADHIGGMDEVVAAIPVRFYVDNGLPHTTATYSDLMRLVEQKGITYQPAESGTVINLGAEVRLELLHPQLTPLTGTRSDLNSNSVVTRLTHGDNCFLFTGDSEEPTEAILMQKGITACKVLKVAHHGSAHSTTDAWLRAVRPEIALISVGTDNRYKHPSPDTISRLERAGAAIYRTDLLGTIHLESDGHTVTVAGERGSPAAPVPVSVAPPPAALAPVPAPPPSAQLPPPPTVSTAAAGQIVLNTASAAELEQIPGIGPSRAALIIAYREANGPFSSFSELENISGIGPKTRQTISEHALLNAP